MIIPAYIIEELQKERARREQPVFEELQIEREIPRPVAPVERPEDTVNGGVSEVDFFI